VAGERRQTEWVRGRAEVLLQDNRPSDLRRRRVGRESRPLNPA
jgi:hypothetical protein